MLQNNVIKRFGRVRTRKTGMSQTQEIKTFPHKMNATWKLYNDKYMISSTKITNTEIFTFITVLVFKLLSRNFFFINKKDNRIVKK